MTNIINQSSALYRSMDNPTSRVFSNALLHLIYKVTIVAGTFISATIYLGYLNLCGDK